MQNTYPKDIKDCMKGCILSDAEAILVKLYKQMLEIAYIFIENC